MRICFLLVAQLYWILAWFYHSCFPNFSSVSSPFRNILIKVFFTYPQGDQGRGGAQYAAMCVCNHLWKPSPKSNLTWLTWHCWHVTFFIPLFLVLSDWCKVEAGLFGSGGVRHITWRLSWCWCMHNGRKTSDVSLFLPAASSQASRMEEVDGAKLAKPSPPQALSVCDGDGGEDDDDIRDSGLATG